MYIPSIDPSTLPTLYDLPSEEVVLEPYFCFPELELGLGIYE